MLKKQIKPAFSLLEIIGVIAIIIILALLIFFNIKSARVKAADGQRIGNIKNLQTALVLYQQDNGVFPSREEVVAGSPLVGPNGGTYLDKVPANPKDDICKNDYGYNPSSDRSSYRIGYCISADGKQCYASPNDMCCTPKCDGKTCGDDGCGRYCPNEAGVEDNCIADCRTGGRIDRVCPPNATKGCFCDGGVYNGSGNDDVVVAVVDDEELNKCTIGASRYCGCGGYQICFNGYYSTCFGSNCLPTITGCANGTSVSCGCGGTQICNNGSYGACIGSNCGGGGGGGGGGTTTCSNGAVQSCGCGGYQVCYGGSFSTCIGSNCTGTTTTCVNGTTQACGCGGMQNCSNDSFGECFNSNCEPGIIVPKIVIEPNIPWGCSGTLINNANSNTNGFVNSFNILAGCVEANIAARVCDNLVSSGYNDWYLPSKGELTQVYNNLKNASLIDQTNIGNYWSSTQADANNAYYQSFGLFSSAEHTKPKASNDVNVLCVRTSIISQRPTMFDYARAVVDKTEICQGEQVALSVAGTYYLAPTDQLVWYRGGCGTERIGTGATMAFNPSTTPNPNNLPEIYYVRAEGSAGNTACVNTGTEVNVICGGRCERCTTIVDAQITVDKNSVCQGEQITLSINGGYLAPGDRWVWYRNYENTTPVGIGATLAISTGTEEQNIELAEVYLVRAEGARGNTEYVRSPVITVKPDPKIKVEYTVGGEICQPGNITLAVNNPNLAYANPFHTVEWYDVPSGGSLLATGNTFVARGLAAGETRTYYVGGVNNSGCHSSVRTPVYAHVVSPNEVLEAPIAYRKSFLCNVQSGNFRGAPYTDSSSTGGHAFAYSPYGYDVKWYASENSADVLHTGNSFMLGINKIYQGQYRFNYYTTAVPKDLLDKYYYTNDELKLYPVLQFEYWVEAVSKCGNKSPRVRIALDKISAPFFNLLNPWFTAVENANKCYSSLSITPIAYKNNVCDQNALNRGYNGNYIAVRGNTPATMGDTTRTNNRLFVVSQGANSDFMPLDGVEYTDGQTVGNSKIYLQPVTPRFSNASNRYNDFISYLDSDGSRVAQHRYEYNDGYSSMQNVSEIAVPATCGNNYNIWIINANEYCYNLTKPVMNPRPEPTIYTGACR